MESWRTETETWDLHDVALKSWPDLEFGICKRLVCTRSVRYLTVESTRDDGTIDRTEIVAAVDIEGAMDGVFAVIMESTPTLDVMQRKQVDVLAIAKDGRRLLMRHFVVTSGDMAVYGRGQTLTMNHADFVCGVVGIVP